MEVLETARVDAYMMHDIIVPASRRNSVLLVVWEGTCSERLTDPMNPRRSGVKTLHPVLKQDSAPVAVWYAGDWTGPIALQPDKHLSSESKTSATHDVVAVSVEGVKVLSIDYYNLHNILLKGSFLYRRYSERRAIRERASFTESAIDTHRLSHTDRLLQEARMTLNILELLNLNSALRKLSAVQKRHLESLAEGPISYQPGERLWKAGNTVDRTFIIVSGSAAFAPRRRKTSARASDVQGDNGSDKVQMDAVLAAKDNGKPTDEKRGDESSMSSADTDDLRKIDQHIHDRHSKHTSGEAVDFEKLSRGLQKRAEFLQHEGGSIGDLSADDDEANMAEYDSQLDFTFTDDNDPVVRSNRSSVIRRRSTRARHANKVLGRLFNRRAFTSGLVFSRGHFLGDVSKMVAGLLSHEPLGADEYEFNFGFGEKSDHGSDSILGSISELVIQEQETDYKLMHSSTLAAGKDGCVVLIFPKSSLIPFLDEHPGLLLSLLGTQVVL
jgi:hypothetical protein